VQGLRASLRIEEFRALLVSYVINRAGDFVGSIALAVIVLGATGSALATAVLFLATQFLPGILGPALVVRVDRLAPGRALPAMYTVECALFLLLAALVHHAGIALLIAVAFADAMIAFAARTITRSAVASTLVPHDLLPEGKAAFNVALAVSMVAGPVIAGLAIASVGPASALAIDGGSFLVATALIVRASKLHATPDVAPSGKSRLREGLAYIARKPALRTLILGEGAAFVFFYLVVPVTVVYATRSLHAGSGGYAAMLTSWGAGVAIGSAVQVRVARRVGGAMILISTGAVAAGYLGTAVAPTLVLACGASVIGGIGNGTQWASVETTMHQLVDEAFRARTTAVLESLAAIAPGAGIVLGGALTVVFSPRAAYFAAGAGLVLLVLAARVKRLAIGMPIAARAQA
jgi:MFS family permease